MANTLYIPDANPVRFYKTNEAELPQYLSRHFENFEFAKQQNNFNQYKQYRQKWQTSDITYLQFQSNYDPIGIQVVDCYDILKASFNALQVRANKYLPGFYCYEASNSWATFSDGIYFIKIVCTGLIMISEPIHVKVKHENTLLFEYKNSRFHADVVFETGIRFTFRVEGVIGNMQPGATDVVYEDQKANPTVLSSRTFRSFPLNIGGPFGVPDWVVDKLNVIWSCNDVWVDGKSFAKSSDTKLELKSQERYPMRGLSMIVREGVNRGSKIVDTVADPNKRIAVVYNIESGLFGDISDQSSSNIIQITAFE